MEAPECQNFSSCGNRHYGACAPGKKSKREKPEQPVDYEKRMEAAPKPADQAQEHADLRAYVDPRAVGLDGRVEVLEKIVAELCGFKKKRSEYMREYMKRYRSEGKGCR